MGAYSPAIYRRSSPYQDPRYQQELAAAANSPNPYRTPSNPIRFDPSTEPKDALINERSRATAMGDLFEDEYRGATVPELEEYRRSRQMADTAWGPISRGEGGYTPQEAGDILDRDRLESLQPSAQEQQSLYLDRDEQAAMLGDPRSAMAYWNPQQLEGVSQTGADYARDVTGDTTGQVRKTYSDPRLQLDPRYGQVQSEAVSGMERGVRGAYDPRALSLDANFASRYPMSDVEVQQHGDLGARMASSRYAALEDEAVRRGASSGTPGLATAALKSRLERDAGIAATDAGTSSRLAALGLQRDQRRQLEDMRLGAERYKTEAGTDIEFGLGRERLLANQDIEGRRLGAAQTQAGLATGAELDLGNLRYGSERDIANRNVDTARYNTEMGVGLEQYGEGESARRNYERSQNRQNTQLQNRADRINTGLAVSDRVSGRTGEVAGARREDEQGYRDYLERRGATSGEMYQRGADRRIQGQQVTGNQSLEAAEGQANLKVGNRNATSNRIGAVAQFFEHGGVVKEPTLAVLGEAGPEAVVPLGGGQSFMSKIGQNIVKPVLDRKKREMYDRYVSPYQSPRTGVDPSYGMGG